MPFKRRRFGFRRRFGRRRFGRRRFGGFRRMSARRAATNRNGITAVPRRENQLIRMRYCVGGTLDPSAGVPIVAATYRANSIWDPDYATGGTVALGHAEWSGIYTNYLVVSSSCQVRTLSESSGVASVLGISLSSVPTVNTTDWTDLIERGGTVWRMQQSAINGNTNTMRSRFQAKRFFGYKDTKDALPLYGANFGANPSQV